MTRGKGLICKDRIQPVRNYTSIISADVVNFPRERRQPRSASCLNHLARENLCLGNQSFQTRNKLQTSGIVQREREYGWTNCNSSQIKDYLNGHISLCCFFSSRSTHAQLAQESSTLIEELFLTRRITELVCF